VSVTLNANLNAGLGKGDAIVLIPDALFGDARYVYLFSRFGDQFGANGGAEAWGVRHHRHGPPAPQAFGLSGNVFADMNGNGTREPLGTQADPTVEPGLAGVTVHAQYTDAQGQVVTLTATTDANGDYSFADLGAGTYTLTVVNPDGFMSGAVTSYTVTLGGGLGASGATGGYNFGELPILAPT